MGILVYTIELFSFFILKHSVTHEYNISIGFSLFVLELVYLKYEFLNNILFNLYFAIKQVFFLNRINRLANSAVLDYSSTRSFLRQNF